jgi:Pentapeptide repeats (8 copies)
MSHICWCFLAHPHEALISSCYPTYLGHDRWLEGCIPEGECGIVNVVNRYWRDVMSYYGGARKTRISDEELRELYASGDRDFSSIKYRLDLVDPAGANLSEANFRGANLAGINLYQVNFSSSDLNGAVLSDSRLVEAILINTILNQAAFERVTITSCDLTNASLIEANFCEAQLVGNNLTRANLTGANIESARIEGNIFFETIMSDGTIRTD